MLSTNTLDVQGVCRSFDGVKALDSVSVSFRQHQISSVIGFNGAGKTTLFHVIGGYLRPDRGRVFYRGTDITGMKPHQVAALGIGRLFQDVRVFRRLTVLENVLVAARIKGENPISPFLTPGIVNRAVKAAAEAAEEHLDSVGLASKSHLSAGQLSFGEQKLLALARLLATEADVLLLDEPASGVESTIVQSIFAILRALAQKGKTIVLIEHDVPLVLRNCDDIHLLENGRIVASGTSREVSASSAFRNTFPGLHAYVER
jgi:ABC-type branched-subunit amino acid transport system ATPase component